MPTQGHTIDSRDLRFCLFELFRAQDVAGRGRFAHLDEDQLRDVLTQAERIAVEVVAPLNAVADRTPPRFEGGTAVMPPAFHEAFRTYAGAGWIPATLPRESGGQGLPETLTMALREIFNGACGGFYAFTALTAGALNLIESFGTAELKRVYREKLANGVFTGTMCLTEPEAGSYLADIQTTARRDGDAFRVSGTKIFIGTGEHDLSQNIIHCVLARIEGAPDGYAGLSLFVVPRNRVAADGTVGPRNDVRCLGIERKMGWDGAPTAALRFGENGECRGWLLGEEGKGLAHMFQMMNELRLATAAQGVGQAAGAYQKALAFAKERVQGLSYKRRKGEPAVQVPIIDHPDVRRNLLFMKSAVEGCRRLILQTALHVDLSHSLADEGERERHNDLVEVLIPICKAYATDMAVRVAETAVVSMGGYGYVKDHGAEQYMRDLVVSCIYEGTNGIHAIDLQRRKLRMKGGEAFRELVRELDGFIEERAGDPELAAAVESLRAARDDMVDVAGRFAEADRKDPGLPLSVAKPFLDLAGHVVCTWMLLRGAAVAREVLGGTNSEAERAFCQGKILTARFAASNFLPQAAGLAETIRRWDRSVLDARAEHL